ncbi:MAG TPA: nuclease domain-containing protein [Candidatus Binataceae bacterium]|nr:nuclease domain-containing protein [Candidatus Binataceae bacterium]
MTRRLGQRLKIELFFNKSFSRNGSQVDGAWTRLMRPDYTICVSAEPQTRGFSTEQVWLHFDAKYSVDSPLEILGPDVPPKEEGAFLDAERASEKRGQYRRVDLLKMHAYRDAIRRSTGAYVLFPGDELKGFAEFFEILPGIGVFPLRPTEVDIAEGAPALENFLSQVLNHLASQLTEHARGGYWNRTVFEGEHGEAPLLDFLGFLSKAPVDTNVLVVAINSDPLHDWVTAHSLIVLPRLEQQGGSLPILAANLGIDLVLVLRGAGDAEFFAIAERVKVLTGLELQRLTFPSPVPSAGLGVEILRPGHRVPKLDVAKVRASCFVAEGESASYSIMSRSLLEIIRAATSD